MPSRDKPTTTKRVSRVADGKPSASEGNRSARAAGGSTAPRAKNRGTTANTNAEDKPVTLLTGGNPQIPKGEGDTPVQAYIAAMPGWKQDVGRRLDALIVGSTPDVRKAVKWNSPFYGTEAHGWFLSVHCFTKYVKVTFFNGASLRPMPPVAFKDPETRALHIHEGESLDEEVLESWFKQASQVPGWIM